MPKPVRKKYGNRKPRRQRARVGRYNCPVDFDLERELRTAYAAIVGADGTVASRALLDAAEGYQHPHRYFLRRLLEGVAAKADPEQIKRPLRVIEQFLDEILRQSPADRRIVA